VVKVNSWAELEVYKQLFSLQQQIFEVTKSWPKEEMYALTDQVRRSSRAVGANIAEAWAKRRYPAHFLSKLTDADSELQETPHWLVSAEACGYLDQETAVQLRSKAETAGRQLGSMMNQYDRFCF